MDLPKTGVQIADLERDAIIVRPIENPKKAPARLPLSQPE
jgi:hypothetical protein